MKGLRKAGIVSAICAFVAVASMAQVNVTTWHNDNARTGQNVNETVLTQSVVGSANRFGKLCSSTIDGQVHAQPLVMNLTISGVSRTAVFAVTQAGSVYVFDGVHSTVGKPCIQIARRNLRPSGVSQLNGGILGTPVIDPASNTMYLVDGYQSGGVGFHFLHAIDITTTALSDKVPPVQIAGGSFASLNAVQRPGLLGVASTSGAPFNTIYVAFARTPNPNANHRGWIFAYDAGNLARKGFYCVTCGTSTGNGGGIWQSAAGPASGIDSSGQSYVFLATGDGTFDLDKGGKNAGDSFLKIGLDLNTIVDYFTPADQACRTCPQQGSEHDVDFGSGGVTLIPDGLLSNFPHLAVLADKEGKIWVIDRDNPGKYNGSSTGTCPGKICTGPNANVETLQASSHEFRSSPAYWNRSLYYAAGFDVLKLYPLANLTCSAGVPPVCAAQASSTPKLGYGATPSISSNGTSNGIVWAIAGNGKPLTTLPGVLFAFSADNLALLYNSNQCKIATVPQDQPGGAMNFSVPTIANGRVYIGTQGGSTGSQGGFHMYGPLTRTCD